MRGTNGSGDKRHSLFGQAEEETIATDASDIARSRLVEPFEPHGDEEAERLIGFLGETGEREVEPSCANGTAVAKTCLVAALPARDVAAFEVATESIHLLLGETEILLRLARMIDGSDLAEQDRRLVVGASMLAAEEATLAPPLLLRKLVKDERKDVIDCLQDLSDQHRHGINGGRWV